MDHEQGTCVLELVALVCYGFLIFVLLLHWPNEANVYLVFFCLSNATLAFVAAYGTVESGERCRWNGILTLIAISVGFESLCYSHRYRRTLVRHQFRLYKARPDFGIALRCILCPTIFAFLPWSFYQPIRQFNMCFLKSSNVTILEESSLSMIWIIFFYARPILLTFHSMPEILWEWYRQIQVLKHENELPMDGKLLLYKDHHRRLFHVIFTIVTVITFFVWLIVTIPYLIQVFCLIVKMDTYIQLDRLSLTNEILFEGVSKSIPFINCFIFIGAFATYLVLRL